MARETSFARFEQMNTIVTYNGVKMTYKQMLDLKRAETRKANKEAEKARIKKNNERAYRLFAALGAETKQLTKAFKLAKSMRAYWDNGYRQWGRVANDIIHHPCIEPHFTAFIVAYNAAEDAKKQIAKISKKNDKDVFQYIEKLAYSIDDMADALRKIADGTVDAHIEEVFKDEKAYFETGRRLGLKELNSRCTTNVIIAKQIFDRLMQMVKSGEDPMQYDANKRIGFFYT